MIFSAEKKKLIKNIQQWLTSSGLVCVFLLALPDFASSESAQRSQLLEGVQKVKARNAYQAYCMSCHGPTGNGRDHAGTVMVPVDFTAPAASANLNRDIIIEAMLAGHDEATRSGWANELGRPAIDGIATYIREAFILPTPALDSSVGQQIYARTCSVCHGERGNGVSLARNSLSPSPRDFTSPDSSKLSRRDMINSVTYGNDGTAMMPFASQYSAGEIAAVVDYIREKFMAAEDSDALHDGEMASSGKHAAHGHTGADEGMMAPFPNALVGDVAKGKTFFDNNCADCHGKTGAGDGPRAYFINPRPRDLTSPKARAEFNRPLLFSAIANGVRLREMAAWSKVLDDQQIADVAEYVFRAFIQPGDMTTPGSPHSDHSQDMPAHGHSTEPAADDTHSADGHGHSSDNVKKN